MATTVNDIHAFLDRFAPFETQLSFDNAGFLVGRGSREVRTVLISLDITEAVAAEAVALGAELVVSHHPVLFHPARAVTDADATGRTILALAEGGVAAICAHTNLDAAHGGVNDALAERLGLTELELLQSAGIDAQGRPYGIGRVGHLSGAEPISADTLSRRVKAALNAPDVRYVDGGRPIRRLAVSGGACQREDLVRAVAMGCEAMVTADVKHDQFLEAVSLGLSLLDAGHFSTENVVCPVLERKLAEAFPNLRVEQTKIHIESYKAV